MGCAALAAVCPFCLGAAGLALCDWAPLTAVMLSLDMSRCVPQWILKLSKRCGGGGGGGVELHSQFPCAERLSTGSLMSRRLTRAPAHRIPRVHRHLLLEFLIRTAAPGCNSLRKRVCEEERCAETAALPAQGGNDRFQELTRNQQLTYVAICWSLAATTVTHN